MSAAPQLRPAAAGMFCPHCHGPLTRAPLKQHPCFDDALCAIVPAHTGNLAAAPIRLTPAEWRLLSALRGAFDRVVTLDYLAGAALGRGAGPRGVDVVLAHLRRKLAETPFAIATAWGCGRRLTWRTAP